MNKQHLDMANVISEITSDISFSTNKGMAHLIQEENKKHNFFGRLLNGRNGKKV